MTLLQPSEGPTRSGGARVLVGMALMCAVACQGADRPSISGAVENPAPDASTPKWRLPIDSAELSLGGNDDSDYDFEAGPQGIFGVFPARLGDGRIVVVDQSPWPVKAYSADGKLLTKFRSGEGPNEFPRGGNGVFVTAGDTIIAGVRYGRGPIRVIDPTLTIVRSIEHFTLPADTGTTQLQAFRLHEKLADGSWIGVHEYGTDPNVSSLRPFTMRHEWLMASPDFTRFRPIDRYDAITMVYEETSSGGFSSISSINFKFGRRTTTEFRGPLLYRAFNKTPEIEIQDTSGKITRRVRIELPPPVLTPALRRSIIDSSLSFNIRLYGESPGDRERIEQTRFADTAGYFGRFLVSDDGSLWASRLVQLPGAPEEFLIFSKEGKLIATTAVPAICRLVAVFSEVGLLNCLDDDHNVLVKVVRIRR